MPYTMRHAEEAQARTRFSGHNGVRHPVCRYYYYYFPPHTSTHTYLLMSKRNSKRNQNGRHGHSEGLSRHGIVLLGLTGATEDPADGVHHVLDALNSLAPLLCFPFTLMHDFRFGFNELFLFLKRLL